ncbi:lysozyme g-like [Lissotriton helveticus]
MWVVLVGLCLAVFIGSVPSESLAGNQDSPRESNKPQGFTTKSGCYGNVMEIMTRGAECEKAKERMLSYCGVKASYQMAETDLEYMSKYKPMILEVGNSLCMDPAVIAGIISYMSCYYTPTTFNWCEMGPSFGLMQISKQYHNIEGAWNSKEHISQGTRILIHMINLVMKKFPSWIQNQHLKGGIAAYNFGIVRIKSYADVENGFSNDVVARAHYFKQHGY